ncbi:loricrin-like [Branchiostoma floridae]|uniref:Loricrin-like n=1 Tax=Branchiostoma floridae TaxID=7739 RepID=A0A9J7M3M0_BRAFL|nr:loricrin-like [Branchiostoma floridae]
MLDLLACPTCRSKTLLPGGGVAELKDNFFVESLKDTVDVHKKLANEGESLVCGSCETKSGAKSFCEVLKILVGQEGGGSKSSYGVGGGGGTFVTKTDNTPLIVAGCVGGGDLLKKRNTNSDGTTATAGQYSSGGRRNFAGGSDGEGATQGDGSYVGGGGGGLLLDGASWKVYFGGTSGNKGAG